MKQPHKLSNNFVSEIFRSTGGFLTPSELDIFFKALETEIGKVHFTRSSENNLLRIINALFDKSSLIRDSIKYPHYLEILITASVNSDYICDILVRDPEFFYWIVNPSNLFNKPSADELKKTAADLKTRYKSFDSKLNAFKSFKRKEILRTGLQDLLKIFTLPEITSQLSLIASVTLDNLFQICYQEVQKKYEVVFNNDYCIIALGKLGGRELNYSSDTDLIILYDKDKKYGRRYYSELLTEAIKLFIESSSRLTDTGYLYRIDFRLRPDGRNSALCRSLQEYLNYYESRGESWERQMLIKSDFLSGDYKLYKKFSDYLKPFIYPFSQHSSPAEQVNKLKTVIEKGLKNELNIKLSKGGIRDIEFSVQVLQLLYGGKNRNLRQQNTLSAIGELHKANLISEVEKDKLAEAYILFRKIEHYLQLMNDRQVHTIPQAGEVVDKMSSYLGYNDRIAFLNELNGVRQSVREFYLSIIPGENEPNIETSIFRNKQQANRDLDYLREGIELTGGKVFDQKTQMLYSKLEPLLLRIMGEMPDPDLVLKSFTFFIKSSGIPSIWYNEFLDENFLRSFFLICSYNSKGINLLTSDNELQDFLLSRRIFGKYSPEELNSFPIRKLILYLSGGLALKQISQEEVSGILSSVIISKIGSISERILGKKDYFIAALGSLGSGEMSFSSDLDLLFITAVGTKIQESKFRELLSEINKEFYFFKADCRLRPEGKTSQLAWDADAYIKYIQTRARIWELQSLCKLQFIYGDKKSFNKIVTSIHSRIKKEECRVIKNSIVEMKNKLLESKNSVLPQKRSIKKSRGGLIDVEFLIQSLILCSPGFFPVCRGKNVLDIIDLLRDNPELTGLKESYSFLKTLEMIIQCMFDTDKAYFPADAEKKNLLKSYFGIEAGELEKTFRNYLHMNSTLSEKVLSH